MTRPKIYLTTDKKIRVGEKSPDGYVPADLAQSLADALEGMIVEWVDYSRINNLGDVEEKHNIKHARAALKKYRGE